MKPSYYNVVAPAANGKDIAIFNTMSSSMAILSPKEFDIYKNLDVIEPNDTHNAEFINELVQAGFALKDPELEAEILRYQFERVKFNSRVFELYILPTLDCNFDCVYCYEYKRKGRMNAQVQDAVIKFVKDEFEKEPYKELKIVWYGGEPLLCLDIIERLSEHFITFCNEKNIEYFASIITNGYLLNGKTREILTRCKVWCVMATMDGIGEVHELTRRSKNGKPSYEIIKENINGCLDCGMCIDFRCVTHKGNIDSCLELASEMAAKDNVGVRLNKMRDMTGFQEKCHGNIEIDMMSPQEHARYVLQEFLNRNPTAEDFQRILRPLPVHCSTTVDREYNIDELGNAYYCSSLVGIDEYVLFNVTESPEKRWINQKLIARLGNENPLDYEQCHSCNVLPLCQGGCTRVRMEGNLTCNPIRYIAADLVTAYSGVLLD